jgi:serine/threonine protein kinase
MSGDPNDAFEAARRIADGETVDLAKVEAEDPALARGLRRLGALARLMHTGVPVGSSWGHLQQLQLAGQGGFGEVYRAYDPTLDRAVALKLKRDDGVDFVASGRDFVAEARRLARVRHPHVLAVHGASYHDGRAGLWSDWIDGETLSARIERDGPLRGEALLRMLRELAEALHAVHAAGLVHGDIKASNVMLDAGGSVILMDFGAGFESSDEGTAVSAGTPRYLAPEIVERRPATLAVDLYAYGVLAHLAATGRFPDQPAGANPPPALARLIAQLLDRDPAARPRADQLQREIDRLIEAPQRRVRRWLLASIAGGLIAVALVTMLGLRREQAERRLAERARDEANATAQFLTDLLAAPAPEVQGREVRVVELLSLATQRARHEPGLSPSTRAEILHTIGRSQLALNNFRDADAALTEAWALDRPEHALAPAQVLQIGLRLVEARNRRENEPEAEALLATLERDPRWQGDAAAAASMMIARADLLSDSDRRDEAMQIAERVLRSGTELSVNQRIAVLRMQGRILFDQRRAEAAEKPIREALALLTGSGARGMYEFETRTLLANILTEQGKLAEAEAIYRDLAEWSKQAFGEDSIGAHLAALHIGVILSTQGRFAEAEALLGAQLPRAVAALGEDNAIVIGVRSNLAAALYQNGRIDEALAEYDVLIPLDESRHGKHGIQTMIDRFNRVEALNAARRHADALADGQALRRTMLDAVGAEHPFTLETEDAIGFALTALGRPADAEPMHRRTARLKTAALGADSPYALLSREYLARALVALGRTAEARDELTGLAADRERVLGAAHPKTVLTRELLASVAARQDAR